MRSPLFVHKFSPLAVGVALVVSGCSGKPARIRPPDVDADAAADAALEQMDKNQDGQLDDAELGASPGLVYVKAAYDGDQNGSLSRDEVAAGLRRWTEGDAGAVVVSYIVQMDGRAFPGAQVRAVPEPFLGDAIKPATGDHGYLAVAPEDRPANAPNLPLILPGLYRIEITHPSRTVPAKYNSQTTLGLEVSSALRTDQAVVWDLRSK